MSTRGLLLLATLSLGCGAEEQSPDSAVAGSDAAAAATSQSCSSGQSGGSGHSAQGGAATAAGSVGTAGNGVEAGAAAGGGANVASCGQWQGVPASGRTLLAIGQDTQEIEAYAGHFGLPGAVMLYTNVADLAGFGDEVDFGTGRQSLEHWTSRPEPLGLQLAVSLAKSQAGNACAADHIPAILSHSLDGAISSMAVALAATARPVLLRFGYEFDNTACHAYEPGGYREAFRHFAGLFRTLGAVNVKLVWNAWGGPPLDVSAWYPGDDVVDYVGVSVFPVGLEPGKLDAVASLAAAHGKPLMVAESTPQAQNPLNDAASWAWFEQLFDYVEMHDVRVLSYINQDWNAQSVWAAQGIWGDSRLQGSAVEAQWRQRVAAPRFLSSSGSLYSELGCSP